MFGDLQHQRRPAVPRRIMPHRRRFLRRPAHDRRRPLLGSRELQGDKLVTRKPLGIKCAAPGLARLADGAVIACGGTTTAACFVPIEGSFGRVRPFGCVLASGEVLFVEATSRRELGQASFRAGASRPMAWSERPQLQRRRLPSRSSPCPMGLFSCRAMVRRCSTRSASACGMRARPCIDRAALPAPVRNEEDETVRDVEHGLVAPVARHRFAPVVEHDGRKGPVAGRPIEKPVQPAGTAREGHEGGRGPGVLVCGGRRAVGR
jgi:hypothetical protein